MAKPHIFVDPRKIAAEPDWVRANVPGKLYPHDELAIGPDNNPLPIMQTDMLKPFYLDIAQYGLNYAYQKVKFTESHPNVTSDEAVEKYKGTKTTKPKTVVIIGAGMSGLVAAHELARAGHKVHILEAQHRVGGRVRTFASEYFYPGLWSDAGAMRIPGTGMIGGDSKHFLTDFYGQDLFQLPVQNFRNQIERGFYFYGGERYKVEDWNKDPGYYCSKVWPHWNDGLSKEVQAKYKIKDIDTYYSATVQPVVNTLIQASDNRPTVEDWFLWVKRWSQCSVEDYLYGSYDEIKLKLSEFDKRHPHDKPLWNEEIEEQLQPLKDLLPWSSDAVTAFQARSYSPGIDTSLSELLRDFIGQWWEDPMHTFKGGMKSLPWAFMEKGQVNLKEAIRFGATVWRVKHHDGVTVSYVNNATRGPLPTFNTGGGGPIVSGDAVIVTLPLNIIRQVTFEPALGTSISNSIADVSYGPSTKIMLQCKEKFWETKYGITGGFSFTDLPISQLHYPTTLPGDNPKDRGILMVYTWKQEALLFGSESEDTAIQVAISEIRKIHPEIDEYFEVGGVQAWYNDPCAQGAFCMLKPYQIRNVTHELLYPTSDNRLYFAGEAISYCNGWIQGALESGLRAAYQFYARNEEGLIQNNAHQKATPHVK